MTSAGDRYSFCDAEPFPTALGAIAEVGRQMSVDEEAGPYLLHSLIQMPAGDGVSTMEWMRTEFSCPSWRDDGDDIEITETGDLDVGDDTYWLIVTPVAANDRGRTVQAGFSFTQIDDTISVIGLGAEGSIDRELFQAMIEVGAEKVLAGIP